MSTIRVNTLQNTSTTDGGISIDTSGHVTVDGVAMPSSGPLSNRNLIINGNFAINQRGGSNTTINTYALDRWRSYGGAMGFTISQQDVLSTLSTSRYAMRFQRTSGNTQTNNTGVAQGIESKNCEGLAGTQLTLSFKARAGANLSGDFGYIFFFGTGTDENPLGMTGQTSDVTSVVASTDWTSYTKTVTVPAGTTQITIGFSYTPSGTAGTNDWFEIAEVQVERGSVATPFEHRSYGDELLRCQRYYCQSVPGSRTASSMTNEMLFGRGESYLSWTYPVIMRAVPSVVTSNDNGTGAGYYTVTSVNNYTNGTVLRNGVNQYSLLTPSSNASYNTKTGYNADAEL